MTENINIESVKKYLLNVFNFNDESYLEFDDELDKATYCTQNLERIKIYMKGKTSKDVIYVIMKFMDCTEKERSLHLNEYKNEITMYTKILPQLGDAIKEFFPHLFAATKYVEDLETVTPTLFLEDLSVGGYQSPKHEYLSDEELKFALAQLGKFHGANYALKLKKPEEYAQLAKLLTVARFIRSKYGLYEILRNSADAHLLNHIERFMKNNQENVFIDKANDFMDKIKNQSSLALLRAKLNPEEPSGIIIHGDFNANNVMFKYDDEGKVTDCKFIDLQQSCYSTPAADFSFLFFMNTSSVKDVKKNWDKIWKSYHDSLIEMFLISSGRQVPIPDFLSLTSMQQEFYNKCFIGCHTTSFFQPFSKTPYGEVMVTKFIEYTELFGRSDNVEDNTTLAHAIVQNKSKNMVTPFMTKEEMEYLLEYYDFIISKYPQTDQLLEDMIEEVIKNQNIIS